MNDEVTLTIDRAGNKFYHNAYGDPHRVDGPAIEFINGNRSWYLAGKRHRADGPAFIWLNGKSIEWWLNGIQYDNPDKMPFELFVAYMKWRANNGK